MQRSFLHRSIYIGILVIFALCSLFCWMQEKRSVLPVYQLPLLCLFCFLVFRKIRIHINSLSVLTISLVCVIRYGIYPVTICLENADGSSYVILSRDALNLMLYEMIVVLFFLNFYTRRLDDVKKNSSSIIADYKLSTLNKFLLLLAFSLVLFFPSLLSVFHFFGIAKSKVPISGVVSIAFLSGLYVGYLFLLSKLSRSGKGGLVSLFASLLIGVVFIFCIAIGNGSVSRWAFLWIGIPTLIILSDMYPNHKRTLVVFSCMALPFAIIAGSFLKFALSDFSITMFFSNFITSESLSEYFGGLSGLSYSMQNLVIDPKAGTLYSTLTDLFCSTPLLSSLFDFEQYSTQSIYLDYLGRTDLICPLLGQSYAHFGFWGAPIFSIMMTLFAVEFERISFKANNVYLKYPSLSLCITFSLFMCLNTIIILSNAWALIVFLIIQLYNRRLCYQL